MKTETLRVNQLSPEGYAWYLRYLDALDARDVARYDTFLAPECELRFNNADPVRGRDAVLGRSDSIGSRSRRSSMNCCRHRAVPPNEALHPTRRPEHRRRIGRCVGRFAGGPGRSAATECCEPSEGGTVSTTPDGSRCSRP